MPTPPKPPAHGGAPAPKTPKDEKKERLAEALRQNLLRRKAATRGAQEQD